MKKLAILLTTIIMISVNGYANTSNDVKNTHHDKVEQTTIQDESLVLFSHCQTVNLGSTTTLFPPLVLEWEVGGPVFVMEYNIRFKPTESGTKMIIKCDLVKKN